MTTGNSPKDQPLKQGGAATLSLFDENPMFVLMKLKQFGVHFYAGKKSNGKPSTPTLEIGRAHV